MISTNRLVVVFLTLVIPSILFATDLRVGAIESPVSPVAVGKPIPVRFWVQNINVLDANQYTLTVTITKKGQGSPVYSTTFEATNLPKLDSVLLTAPTQFTPPSEGEYDMTVSITFSEDINNANNSKTTSFTAIAAPNVGTRIRQFSYFSPTGDSLSTMGMIEFTVPPQQSYCYLNVLIRRSDTSSPVWIVRNLLFLSPGFTPQNPIGMFIDFKRIGIEPGQMADSVVLCVYCTEVALTEPPAPDVTCEWYNVTPDIYAVGKGSVEDAAQQQPDWFISDSLPTFLKLATLTDTVERGCTVPNIDLNDTDHPSVDGGYDGDWNACAPVAIANSMQWLENVGKISTGLTERQKLEELSALCNRDENGNTSFLDFVKAKLAFIDKYKLPIKVKYQAVWGEAKDLPSPDGRYGHSADYQGGPGERFTKERWPKWEWMVKEMQDSEDVEMMLGWWNRDKERVRGHYITITGTAVINGQKQFRFKEDDDQAQAGGTHMPSVFWKTDASGASLVSDFSSREAVCFIEGIVSESPDTSVKFIDGSVNGQLKDKHVLLSLEKNPTFGTEPVTIDVYIGKPGHYQLAVLDLAGREIARLADGYFDFGAKRYYWSGALSNTTPAPNGIYILKMEGMGARETTKIVRY